MLSGKDITIDKDGSIILNGDKYPLASQAEIDAVKEDIDAVKEDIDDLGDTIGDITQTGITGSDVASQLENVNNFIEGLILSDASADSIDVDGTYQIPSTMLSKDIIVIGVTRSSLCGTIVIPTIQIKNGNCANGLKIVSGDSSSPTTDKYAILTISKTGLITVKYLSNWSPLYFALKAI